MGDLYRLYQHEERVKGAYRKAEFEVLRAHHPHHPTATTRPPTRYLGALQVRKEKRVDYYDLLGISKIASEMEIKMAYKQKATYHPVSLAPVCAFVCVPTLR